MNTELIRFLLDRTHCSTLRTYQSCYFLPWIHLYFTPLRRFLLFSSICDCDEILTPLHKLNTDDISVTKMARYHGEKNWENTEEILKGRESSNLAVGLRSKEPSIIEKRGKKVPSEMVRKRLNGTGREVILLLWESPADFQLRVYFSVDVIRMYVNRTFTHREKR